MPAFQLRDLYMPWTCVLHLPEKVTAFKTPIKLEVFKNKTALQEL